MCADETYPLSINNTKELLQLVSQKFLVNFFKYNDTKKYNGRVTYECKNLTLVSLIPQSCKLS
jgi:hypothetical protein